jgi:hypothetical protein
MPENIENCKRNHTSLSQVVYQLIHHPFSVDAVIESEMESGGFMLPLSADEIERGVPFLSFRPPGLYFLADWQRNIDANDRRGL